jgi:crotonobetainyl-CoA:carnitine CoA-transferase CaiB-like acyl-CoA transferase
VVVVDEHVPAERRGRRDVVGEGGDFPPGGLSYMRRNARRIALDLKHPDGQAVLARLAGWADVLLESFRPGVAARLGLGVEALRARHPRLVYCSISGYGQDGPYRDRPGHDINYLALGGMLGGGLGAPAMPTTIVADLAAGGMQAALGVLGALLARERGGPGQVIDVSMQEGVVALMSPMLAGVAGGGREARWGGYLTGAAPWYNLYATSDGRHLAVGALEPWFWTELSRRLGHPEWAALQFTPHAFPAIHAELTRIFAARTLAEWTAELVDADVCVTPVLTLAETLADPQLAARGTFLRDADGVPQARTLPRLAGSQEPRPPPAPGADAAELLAELGFDPAERERLLADGGVG